MWGTIWNTVKFIVSATLGIDDLWNLFNSNKATPIQKYTLLTFSTVDWINGIFRDWFDVWEWPIRSSTDWVYNIFQNYWLRKGWMIDYIVDRTYNIIEPWWVSYAWMITSDINIWYGQVSPFWRVWGNPLASIFPEFYQDFWPFWKGGKSTIIGFLSDMYGWLKGAIVLVYGWVITVATWVSTFLMPVWAPFKAGMDFIKDVLDKIDGGVNRILKVFDDFQHFLDSTIFGQVIEVRGKLEDCIIRVGNVVGIFSKSEAAKFEGWFKDKIDMAFSGVDTLDLVIRAKWLSIKNAVLDVTDMTIGVAKRKLTDVIDMADRVKNTMDYITEDGRRIAKTPFTETVFTYQNETAEALFHVRPYKPSAWRPPEVDAEKIPKWMSTIIKGIEEWLEGDMAVAAQLVEDTKDEMEKTGGFPGDRPVYVHPKALLDIDPVFARQYNDTAETIRSTLINISREIYIIHQDNMDRLWADVSEVAELRNDRLILPLNSAAGYVRNINWNITSSITTGLTAAIETLETAIHEVEVF